MRMNWMKICVVAATLVATASWSQAQQPASPASVNQLLVEAGRLIISAKSARTPERTTTLLEEAQCHSFSGGWRVNFIGFRFARTVTP